MKQVQTKLPDGFFNKAFPERLFTWVWFEAWWAIISSPRKSIQPTRWACEGMQDGAVKNLHQEEIINQTEANWSKNARVDLTHLRITFPGTAESLAWILLSCRWSEKGILIKPARKAPESMAQRKKGVSFRIKFGEWKNVEEDLKQWQRNKPEQVVCMKERATII